MPYTVDQAIAAVDNAQAAQPPDKYAYIQASVSITDAAAGTITGNGGLYRRIPFLGNMGNVVWDSAYQFLMQRGATGPRFLLGLEIEPFITLVGPIAIQPPAFAWPSLQRLRFLRKRYLGDFGFYMQPGFSTVLNEDQVNPRLTGTITPSAHTWSAITPPGTIEVVLKSVAIGDVFQ